MLRTDLRDPAESARRAGWIVGANTVGSVLGVGLAVWVIPALGLRLTLASAAAGSLAVGLAALAAARREVGHSVAAGPAWRSRRPLLALGWVLTAAAAARVVGAAVLLHSPAQPAEGSRRGRCSR